MLDLKLPWKKVKVGGPIDFAQWQMSEQVRGMHLAVDKEGDLIVMPTFSIDVTTEKARMQESWTWLSYQQQGIIAPSTTAFVTQTTIPATPAEYEIDWINVHSVNGAAADTMFIMLYCGLFPTWSWEMIVRESAVFPAAIGVNQRASWIPNTPFRFKIQVGYVLIYVGMTTDATPGNRTVTTTVGLRRKLV